MSVTIKLRKGLASEWAANSSIVLASGEPGFEIDTGRLKIGNGVTQWGSLSYASVVPAGFLAGSGIAVNLGPNGSTATVSVSGLINNPANNRILTSRDNTTTGIDAESNLTFNKNYLVINSSGLRINQPEGDGSVAIDVTSAGDSCFSLVPQTPQSSGYMAFGVHSDPASSAFNVAINNATFYSRTRTSDLIATSGFLNQVVFNTGLADPNLLAGQLQWNSTEGTLDLGLSDNYAMHLGEEMLYRIRNTTDKTFRAGQPVYVSELSPGGNNRIEVNLYVADGTISEARFMGLITEDVPDNGNNGYATHFGYIRGIDTRGDAATYGTTNKLWASGEPAWNEGDILYVHPTVAGKLTKIEPTHSISVAIVTNKASNGKIFVRPTSYGRDRATHTGTQEISTVSGLQTALNSKLAESTDRYIICKAGDDILSKYAAAKLLTPGGNPISATNRAYLIVMPGVYPLSAQWEIDTEFVDVIGLGSSPLDRGCNVSVTVTDHDINVSANNVRIKGIGTPSDRAFKIDGDKPLQVFEECIGGYWFDNYSFGGFGGSASGSFTNCSGGIYSFGGSGGTASGSFTNCSGGDYSFGGFGGTASGSFKDCSGGNYSFGGSSGTASGSFKDCSGGDYSFGGLGTASGSFKDCSGGDYSFGGSGGTASGSFTNCSGGIYSFGGDGTASGSFKDCSGGIYSFGGSSGIASGKFLRCTLTTGSFPILSGNGKYRLCIDGNYDVINADAPPPPPPTTTPRTLYFNPAVDNDWQTVGNWWNDAEFTSPATSLPTSVDSVVGINTGFISNSGSEPTVVDFTMYNTYDDPTLVSVIEINITITGNATFNGYAANVGTITGNATFNDNSGNYATVTGNATFNDGSVNGGTVTGTATFNDNACNLGTAGTFVPDPPTLC